MKKLIAIFPILFENKNYKPGDELPAHNSGLVETWINNGAAVWQDKEEEKKIKAKPVTALAGRTGNAYPSAGPEQDLVGKPPSRKARGAQPEPSKGKRKSGE